MITSLSSSISALQAFQKKTDVLADNVANINTNRFKRTRVDMLEGKNGSVEVSLSKDRQKGHPVEEIENGKMIQTESSNTDLTEEITEGLVAEKGYAANLKILKATEDMLGTLLNTFG